MIAKAKVGIYLRLVLCPNDESREGSHTNASIMRMSSRPKPLEIQRRVYTRMARRTVTRNNKRETVMKAPGPAVVGLT